MNQQVEASTQSLLSIPSHRQTPLKYVYLCAFQTNKIHPFKIKRRCYLQEFWRDPDFKSCLNSLRSSPHCSPPAPGSPRKNLLSAWIPGNTRGSGRPSRVWSRPRPPPGLRAWEAHQGQEQGWGDQGGEAGAGGSAGGALGKAVEKLKGGLAHPRTTSQAALADLQAHEEFALWPGKRLYGLEVYL